MATEPADKIEITPEMIRAGLNALSDGEHPMCPGCEVSAQTMVDAYIAMGRLKDR